LFCLLGVASAHIHWAYPIPRSLEANKQPYACGNDPFFADGAPVTTLAPGLQWLEVTEYICHKGAPMRIALSVNDDTNYDQHVLLAHIPHIDSACSDLQTYTMRIGVRIPNINCTRCSLQAMSVMTDKIPAGTCCQYPPQPGQAKPCFTPGGLYLTCANIVITGTEPVSSLANSSLSDPNVIMTWANGESYDKAWSLMDDHYYSLNSPYPSFPANYCTCAGSSCSITGSWGADVAPLMPDPSSCTMRSTYTCIPGLLSLLQAVVVLSFLILFILITIGLTVYVICLRRRLAAPSRY